MMVITLCLCHYFIPSNSAEEEPKKLLLFYHGSREIALIYPLMNSKILEIASENNMIVFFGQADGEMVAPYEHPIYHDISFGELYWGIIPSQNVEKDILYTQKVIDYFRMKYSEITEVNYLGFSNGGIFSCLLAAQLPNYFSKIANVKGGIGYDTRMVIDFDNLQDSDQKASLMFLTSELDEYKMVTEQAFTLFSNMDFHCELFFSDNSKEGHVYTSNCEEIIFHWLLRENNGRKGEKKIE